MSRNPDPLLRASAKFLGLAKLAMATRLHQQPGQSLILRENKNGLSLAAHKWLQEAGAYAPPHDLHLLALASWGLENGVQGEWPSRDRSALEEQVGLLFGWKPKNVLAWLVSNPNGPAEEQEENLRQALVWAQNARQAAAVVLNEIYSRMKSQLPALQPAASEFPWDSKE